jgi:hypothetical protein
VTQAVTRQQPIRETLVDPRLTMRALAHAMEDPLVPSNERSGFPQGIVAPGRRKDGGEPGGLILGQLGGGLSEVMPCRRLGSVHP